MFAKRFFVSWIVSAIVMFVAFYAWHGLFLNDFSRISYPKQVFLIIAAFVYLVISLLVNLVYGVQWPSSIHRSPVIKGIAAGASGGIVIFCISLVVGISFSNSLDVKSLIFDLCWQTIEQALGGACVGLIHAYFFNSFFVKQD